MDLIQGDIVENEEENVVWRETWGDMKSLVWLEWTERQCRDVPLLFKTSIHTYGDLVALSDAAEISSVVDQSAEDVIACTVAEEGGVRVEQQEEEGGAGKKRLHCVDDMYLMNNYTRFARVRQH